MTTTSRLTHAGVVCALFVGLAAGDAGAAGRLLPDRDFCRTSAFGSWRFGHLHGGVDLSTGGVEGAPVAAVDSCWVWRVSVRNEGYGKALYLRLADGRIAVYGHLSAFAPEIEEAVEREQDLRGSYEVDIYNEPYAVTFARGDTIGWSGSTGWGPPHLHFEIRSGMYDHLKINPFPRYLDCVDTLAPVIEAVRVVPAGCRTSIDGDFVGLTLEDFARPDTLSIGGDFGVMVSASDYTACGRLTSPVLYEAYVDGDLVWRLDLRRFPFSKKNYVWSLYDFGGDGRKYVRLFNPWNLDFGGFDVAHPDTGYGGFAPGPHELRIDVADACGNTATAVLPFRYGEFPSFEEFKAERTDGGARVEVRVRPDTSRVDLWYRAAGGPWTPVRAGPAGAGRREFTFPAPGGAVEMRCRVTGGPGFAREGRFRLPGPGGGGGEPHLDLEVTGRALRIAAGSAVAPSELPAVRIFEGIRMHEVVLQPVGDGVYRASYVPRCSGDAVQARVVMRYGTGKAAAVAGAPVACLERASSSVLLTESFRLRIEVPRDMRPGVLLGYREEAPRYFEGYTDSLGGVVFEPAGTFFGEKARVCLALREGGMTVKQGVFADRGGKASFRARADSSGVVCFETDFLEDLVVLEDRRPPEISGFRGKGRREDGRYLFTARAVDAGSGIDPGTVAAFVDGEAAIVGYDPDTGLITGRTRKRLREGEHEFTLEVKDKMGNRTSVERLVSVR